jgi:hypothetical protein
MWGCVTGTDPNTGDPTKHVDPNSPVVVGGEMAAEGIAAVAPFFGPVGGLVGGIAVGVLAAWRKIKPSLTAAKTEAEHYHAAASATVTAMEQFKESAPDAWSKLGGLVSEELKKQGIDPKIVENVIRGLRGLSAKA